jgi:hypothetical protein
MCFVARFLYGQNLYRMTCSSFSRILSQNSAQSQLLLWDCFADSLFLTEPPAFSMQPAALPGSHMPAAALRSGVEEWQGGPAAQAAALLLASHTARTEHPHYVPQRALRGPCLTRCVRPPQRQITPTRTLALSRWRDQQAQAADSTAVCATAQPTTRLLAQHGEYTLMRVRRRRWTAVAHGPDRRAPTFLP